MITLLTFSGIKIPSQMTKKLSLFILLILISTASEAAWLSPVKLTDNSAADQVPAISGDGVSLPSKPVQMLRADTDLAALSSGSISSPSSRGDTAWNIAR